jgi:hypothetical protein
MDVKLGANTPPLRLQPTSGGLCKEVNRSGSLSSSYCRMSQRELTPGLEDEAEIRLGQVRKMTSNAETASQAHGKKLDDNIMVCMIKLAFECTTHPT